jgi:WD40 repeat protein
MKNFALFSSMLLLAGLLTGCKPAHEPPPADQPPPGAPPPTPAATGSATPGAAPDAEAAQTIAAPRNLVEWADLGVGKGPVYSQSWSRDGRWLATADAELIHVWEVASRTQVALLEGHTSFVWGLAFSPDGARLASASQDGSLRLWDTASFTGAAALESGWAFCVGWSPDGSRLALGNIQGEVQIWDATTLEKLSTWKGEQNSAIISLGWSPDGKTLASGALNGGLTLWDVESGQPRLEMLGYTRARSDANGLSWSPDGQSLASAHQDGVLRLWDPVSGELQAEIQAHQGWARGIAWSPDGSRLLSGGQDKRLVVWDAHSAHEYAEQHHNHLPVWSVAWSPDGTILASGAGGYEQAHTGATILWKIP